MFQAYKNNSTAPIEAKYVFPLDDMAAGMLPSLCMSRSQALVQGSLGTRLGYDVSQCFIGSQQMPGVVCVCVRA